jgi:hypothetical protein
VLHFKSLTPNQIDTAAMIVMRLCKEGFRDEIIFGLSGMTFRYGILEASAEEILAELCDSTNDAEKANRLQVLRNT